MRNSNSSERIKILGTRMGLSQKEFALKAGIREASISHYIHGKSEPNQKTLFKIAEAFHVSPSWLMGYGSDTEIERF